MTVSLTSQLAVARRYRTVGGSYRRVRWVKTDGVVRRSPVRPRVGSGEPDQLVGQDLVLPWPRVPSFP